MANAMNITRLEGWQGVQRDLQKLPYLIDQKKFFIAAFRNTAKHVVKAARGGITPDTGLLKKSVKVFVTGKGRKDGFVTIGVRIPKGQQWEGGAVYGQQVEYGTVKMAAKPFMRPAWSSTKNTVEKEMINSCKAIVARAIKGLNKGKRYYEWKI
tara:strand:- start:266 stop:727 length:462 start_codon:yes stop_codon:yes gene_type:complete